ncbi:MAG TPA: hypothetical protein VJJ80_01625 [Patescibacteria group bacterium]|nr:hypothetical protein [Patescibacteria group bacterium]
MADNDAVSQVANAFNLAAVVEAILYEDWETLFSGQGHAKGGAAEYEANRLERLSHVTAFLESAIIGYEIIIDPGQATRYEGDSANTFCNNFRLVQSAFEKNEIKDIEQAYRHLLNLVEILKTVPEIITKLFELRNSLGALESQLRDQAKQTLGVEG